MPTSSRRRIVMVSLLAAGGVAFLAASFGAWMRMRQRGIDDAELQLDQPPRFEWRSVDKKHWQAISTLPPEDVAAVDDREGTRKSCPAGMVDVAGKYLLDASGAAESWAIEEMQNQACTKWINRDFPARCASFDRTQWLAAIQPLPRRETRFCMDRFEYPNEKGQNPLIVVTYNEAAAMCRAKSKRLCTEVEWTFACEGEEARPYPYGYDRDPEACVVDQPWRPFVEGALSPRDGEQAKDELDRLWQGRPSGSRPACRSPFGVYDLTGNVDEWTTTARSSGYKSVLKGGYWGPVRARCRPATRAHDESFVAYQQGFRCCTDADAPPPPTPTATPTSTATPTPTPTPTPTSTSTDDEDKSLRDRWEERKRKIVSGCAKAF